MAKRHLHSYIRIETGMGLLWKCLDPTCNHYMPKHLENTLIGRAAVCPNCETQFNITSISGAAGSKMLCLDCKLGGSSFDEVFEQVGSQLRDKASDSSRK